MHNVTELRIITLQQEIKRLTDEQEIARQSIMDLRKQVKPAIAEIRNLLEYETGLYHDILSRRLAINRLQRYAVTVGQANG